MSFTADDIQQVLRIIQECDNCALHLEIGDLKLYVARGNVGDGAASPMDFTEESTVSQSVPPEQETAAMASTSVKKEMTQTPAAPVELEIPEDTVEEGDMVLAQGGDIKLLPQ